MRAPTARIAHRTGHDAAGDVPGGRTDGYGPAPQAFCAHMRIRLNG